MLLGTVRSDIFRPWDCFFCKVWYNIFKVRSDFLFKRGTAMRIPEGAREIIGVLKRAGYEAYLVGGCVRDMLLAEEAGGGERSGSS